MLERIVLDVETYWDVDYTLKKMTNLEYIRDSRFQLLCGVLCRESNGFKPQFFRRDELIRVLQGIDWSNTELITHNMHFDGLIMTEILHLFPARYTCSLSYSRFHNKGATRHGIDALGPFYGVEGKAGDLSKITKGKRYEDLTDQEWSDTEIYTIRDGKLGTLVWLELESHVPECERIIQDMIFRMAFEPTLELDHALIQEAIKDAEAKRAENIGNYDLTMLRSRERFAQALRDLGIDPPMKMGKPGKDGIAKPTYAFAKKDEEFLELLEHPNEDIADLVEAKLESSSNIVLTRANRLANMGKHLIVCLLPSGAETDRMSGGGKVNVQNFNRGSKLRKSIKPPPGYLLFVPDQSQVEARINASLSDQDDLVDAFKAGRDVYCELSVDVFGEYPHLHRENDEHFMMRFVCKTLILGCGYMTGWRKLQTELAVSQKRLKLSDARCQELVNMYRQKYWAIALNWQRQNDHMLRLCGNGDPFEYKWLEFRPREKRVYYPDGSSMLYTNLHVNEDRRMVYWRATRGWVDMYGGKETEHICQKTGNLIIKENAIDILQEMGLRAVNTVHDELWYLLKESEAEAQSKRILEIMNTPKGWFSSIPVAAEGKLMTCYAK